MSERTSFEYDVFLSHSSKDKPVVRELAERLRKDGLKVWFDEWVLQIGDSIPAEIEEGLERSRLLVLCMSANSFGSDWAGLESQTFRFRDPQNRARLFLPVRLDDAPLRGSLGQFLYVDWRGLANHEAEYAKLLAACRTLATNPERTDIAEPPVSRPLAAAADPSAAQVGELHRFFVAGHTDSVMSVAFSPDGQHALSASDDRTVRLWDVASRHSLAVFEGHTNSVLSVAFSLDGQRALSASRDHTIRLWDVASGRSLAVLEGHTDNVWSVAFSPDGQHALSASRDHTVRLWDVASGRSLAVLMGHTGSVWSVTFSPDGQRALSASLDRTVRLWDVASRRSLAVFKGHSNSVLSVAFSPDGQHALSASRDHTVRLWDVASGRSLAVFESHTDSVMSVAFSPDGQRALSASHDRTMRLWDIASERCLAVFEGHTDSIFCVAFSPDGQRALSASRDRTLRLWDLKAMRALGTLNGHTDAVRRLAWSSDMSLALSASDDCTICLWEAATGRFLARYTGHTGAVLSVAFSPDDKRALSGSDDRTVRMWDVTTGLMLGKWEGHTHSVLSVAWSPDGLRALSASHDCTVRLWEIASGSTLSILSGHSGSVWDLGWSHSGKRAVSASADGTVRIWELEEERCLGVFEGHTGAVLSVAWSPDDTRLLSASRDCTVRLWEVARRRLLAVYEGHAADVWTVVWSPDGRQALSTSFDHTVRLWDVATGRLTAAFVGLATVRSIAWTADGSSALSVSSAGFCSQWTLPASNNEPIRPPRRYTNAKVLLVGESGVGKTGLSQRLALETFDATVSTDGVWATQLPLVAESDSSIEREIWLWDFAGQVDYRLVHQLFMDDTAAAVLVFDPQDEKWYDALGQWDRELRRSSRRPFAKLLAAGRIDRGGLVVSRESVHRFLSERGFRGPLHLTSAYSGEGCAGLKEAIIAAIDWDSIPLTSTPELYKRLKDEILRLRDSGIRLIRLAELNQRLQVELPEHPFVLEQLETVIGLLSGPGLIKRLDFGSFVLLHPEILSRYASALVRKVRKHPKEFGCISEAEFLAGDLDYQDFERLPRGDEEVLLRALLETCVQRAWCLRQAEGAQTLLVFPSYFRRERPVPPQHPNVLVTYRFEGAADDIYATFVVRLHHTPAFEALALWKDTADFQDHAGGKLGLALHRESEGAARLELYFEPGIEVGSQVTFLRYAHEHLQATATSFRRLRQYYCQNPECDSRAVPVEQARVDKAVGAGKEKVFCPDCGFSISLRDIIEEKFESPELREEVRRQQDASKAEIDNESLELILVGHAYAIAGEAGQIYRSYTNSDHGLDGEIEFKNDSGQASGQKFYLQLKSGDSYLHERKRDRVEIFRIKEERWATYWQAQAYPVMLVIRTSDGKIRWMNVTEYLKRETARLGRLPKQIEFEGERFDAYTVRKMRDRVLGAAT